MSGTYITTLCVGLFFVVVIIAFMTTAIRVVPESQRLVIFRLGRPLERAKGPGLVMLVPMIDRGLRVDLREVMCEVAPQVVRSLDQLPISVACRWYYRVIDPIQSILAVGNHESAAIGMATTTIRTVLGEMKAKDIPTKRDYINQVLRTKLDEETQRWGVRVTNFEISQLAVEDHQLELDRAQTTIGTLGEAQTSIFTSGTVLIGNQTWDAMSTHPIAPHSKVRIKRIVLEVESDNPSIH